MRMFSPDLGTLIIIGGLAGYAALGSFFFIGRYVFPDLGPPTPIIDCAAEETKSIVACEDLALHLDGELRQTEYTLQFCQETQQTWINRASQCMILLGKVKFECDNYNQE